MQEKELIQDMPEEAPAQEAEETAEAAEVVVDDTAAKLQAKCDEYLAMAQRIQADFDNFRRRTESVRADALAEGGRKVAAEMLPVLDNLERALAASETAADASAIRSGVELTLRQLNDAFTKLDIAPIDRVGEPFDPTLENAVLMGTAEEGEPGHVCAVFQKGYTMGGHVIRHAMVKVVSED